MEIYAFGSVTRGEIDKYSDLDLLLLKDKDEYLPYIDTEQFSIYTYDRISELWSEGNPFAWHLYTESKCIFTSNKQTFLKSLGTPNKYSNLTHDLHKFHQLFTTSKYSVLNNKYSIDFDLSMIFLSIRNFASCFSLGLQGRVEFSRDSALRIERFPLNINYAVYNRLRESRLFATRGIGDKVTEYELQMILDEIPLIENWFNNLLKLTK